MKHNTIYKIKILNDSPFDFAGDELTISDFRLKYGYICSNDVTDEELIQYLREYQNNPVTRTRQQSVAGWFEVIEVPTNNFRVGDWVWHEGLKKAFCVTVYPSEGEYWKPNYVSFEAANKFVDIYKRKATQEEIDLYVLSLFCDGRVLIGRTTCYYFNNTWKPLSGVVANVTQYLKSSAEYRNINVLSPEHEIQNFWTCKPNGLKIGCVSVSHDEIIKIAKHLKLIP